MKIHDQARMVALQTSVTFWSGEHAQLASQHENLKDQFDKLQDREFRLVQRVIALEERIERLRQVPEEDAETDGSTEPLTSYPKHTGGNLPS